MKQTILILTLLCAAKSIQAQVGIGTSSPASSSILDVTSTSKGFLPPRMTLAQRDAISSPVAGLMIWCTDCGSNGDLQTYNGSLWTNLSGGPTQAKFIGSAIQGEAASDRSGNSLSMSSDGSIVAIGAYLNDGNSSNSGHVRVYQNVNGTWTKIGSDIDGEASGDQSGYSVSLSSNGTIVAIGAPYNDGNGSNSGHVRVYQNVSGTWTKIGSDIDGEASSDESGTSVSLSSDGTIVAIGAPNNSGNTTRAGHVRVYQNVSGAWTKIGSDIDGEASSDESGSSVSLSSDGTVVAIGAPFNDGSYSNSGHIRVYKNTNGTWTKIGSDIDGTMTNYNTGNTNRISLSGDGSTLVTGEIVSGSNNGNVKVYKNVSGTWTQKGVMYGSNSDYFGYSVSINSDGSIIAVGERNANHGDGFTGGGIGAVHVFKYLNNKWKRIKSIYGEVQSDYSGETVSLSSDGSTIAIGSLYNDDNGDSSGHVRVFKL